MPSTVTRAGRYSSQSNDCKAFVPAPLPPTPEIDYDGELRTLLSNADRDIGRLDAIAALLPNHAKTLKLLDHLFQQPLASRSASPSGSAAATPPR